MCTFKKSLEGMKVNNELTYLVILKYAKSFLSEFYGFHLARIFVALIQVIRGHVPREQY